MQQKFKKSNFPFRFFLLFFLIIFASQASQSPQEDKLNPNKQATQTSPPSRGIFALTPSQQPGPLISLGQNIIDKNQVQVFFFADVFKGKEKQAIDLIPSLLYGLTDDLSLFLNVPVAVGYKQNEQHSAGIEDLFIQAEYAFYGKKTVEWFDQATFITNISFPTGSIKKEPATGVGAASFLVAATFSRTTPDWFGFTSPGVVFTTSHQGTKFGNQFLYQCGYGRNISAVKSEYIFAWMLEIDGQYNQKNKLRTIDDPNSGGNTIYVTPSLWLSSSQWVAQLGVGLPVAQHLYGNQKRNYYSLNFNIGWTF